MTHDSKAFTFTSGAVAAALALALSACGGGGDSGPSPPGSVDVTPANQDQLSRAAAAAAQGGFASVPLAGGGAGPQAAGRPHAMTNVLVRALDTQRRQALAVLGPIVDACLVSGTTSISLDDRDNSGSASVGDTLTVVFSNCQDVEGETSNGTLAATLTSLTPLPRLSFGAAATFSNLSFAMSGHSAVYNGDVALGFADASATVTTMRAVVGNQLVAAVTTPNFSDTFTMLAGHTIESTYDAAAVAPGGGSSGLTTSTANGHVASAAAGGYVQVTTLQPILQYDADTFPRSGQIDVVGKNGSLQLLVQPGGLVRIDLDSNGDGVIDQTKTVDWDWIF